jgi:type I restriction enzyme M protein
MLKKGGRSATIVPDGVLFGSSKAHTALRALLVKENQLEAVISLPSGVFKPYAGVSTAILVFARGGKTDQVFFYDVGTDGYSLDDKRDESGPEKGPIGPIKDNDLYDALACWRKKSAKKDTDRTAKHFMVPLKEIAEKDFDLSINRYKETKHEAVKYDPPKKIIAKLRALEADIAKDLNELEGML